MEEGETSGEGGGSGEEEGDALLEQFVVTIEGGCRAATPKELMTCAFTHIRNFLLLILLEAEGDGQIWHKLMDVGKNWRNWQILEEFGRTWQNLAEFGRIWRGEDGEIGEGKEGGGGVENSPHA